MISIIQPLAAGNALRIWLQPPAAASRTRLLRKETDDFVGSDDPDAFVVLDGISFAVTDFLGLMNGIPVFYRAYYLIGASWVASESVSATPAFGFSPAVVDPLSLLRDRLQLGLQSFVDSGALTNERGFIPVMTSSPQIEGTSFPVVTVHLADDAAEIRALGEEVGTEFLSPVDGLWHSFEGTLSRQAITIAGWSFNADERIALRNAIKAVLIANLPVFDAAGVQQVSFSFTDQDDYETYQAPMFTALGTFNCIAATAVETTSPAVSAVSATITTGV